MLLGSSSSPFSYGSDDVEVSKLLVMVRWRQSQGQERSSPPGSAAYGGEFEEGGR